MAKKITLPEIAAEFYPHWAHEFAFRGETPPTLEAFTAKLRKDVTPLPPHVRTAANVRQLAEHLLEGQRWQSDEAVCEGMDRAFADAMAGRVAA